LTLNEDLVSQAKAMTDNLSAVVETLLAEFVDRGRQERMEKSKAIESIVAVWNDFNDKSGSVADEHSPL
jgi:post-segregation antitoxin (ccd killing protein)